MKFKKMRNHMAEVRKREMEQHEAERGNKLFKSKTLTRCGIPKLYRSVCMSVGDSKEEGQRVIV